MIRRFDAQNGAAGEVQHDKKVVQAWGRSRNLRGLGPRPAETVASSGCCDGACFYSDPKLYPKLTNKTIAAATAAKSNAFIVCPRV